jgi:hypothetical protein
MPDLFYYTDVLSAVKHQNPPCSLSDPPISAAKVLRRPTGRAIIPQELQEDKNGLEREEVCILAEAIQAVNGKWARVGSLILPACL